MFVVERLGKFYTTWSFITKDNVTMRIDSIVVMQVTDVKLFTYGVGNPINGLESLTATTLRSIVGSMNYDETLTSRDRINARMETTLDAATAQWSTQWSNNRNIDDFLTICCPIC